MCFQGAGEESSGLQKDIQGKRRKKGGSQIIKCEKRK